MSTSDSNPKPSVEFLFLASHGLLSPISAIRWGCNRLKRTETDNLSKEQQELLEHIYTNARVLSKLFGSMLLLARNEDQTYSIQSEPIALMPVLQAEARDWEEHEQAQATVKGTAMLKATTDSALLEAIVQNILAVCIESLAAPKKVTIECTEQDGKACIIFTGKMELAFLQQVRTIDHLSEARPIVGGTAGLLLSLSQALVGFLSGSLDMHEEEEGEYMITVKLPM